MLVGASEIRKPLGVILGASEIRKRLGVITGFRNSEGSIGF